VLLPLARAFRTRTQAQVAAHPPAGFEPVPVAHLAFQQLFGKAAHALWPGTLAGRLNLVGQLFDLVVEKQRALMQGLNQRHEPRRQHPLVLRPVPSPIPVAFQAEPTWQRQAPPDGPADKAQSVVTTGR
jgi:hypothetical protein